MLPFFFSQLQWVNFGPFMEVWFLSCSLINIFIEKLPIYKLYKKNSLGLTSLRVLARLSITYVDDQRTFMSRRSISTFLPLRFWIFSSHSLCFADDWACEDHIADALPSKKKVTTNLHCNRTYKANLIPLEGIDIWFMVSWFLQIKMLRLAVGRDQSLRHQVNNMGKTSIIHLKHETQLETWSAPDMIRFPVPFLF